MKSTSVPNTIASNRMLSEKIPYPLHLGVTEAGTKWSGSLKSAVGLGTLLADGIGDTIRISLSTFHAEEEVKVAWEILKALKLRERGPDLIACPTCGRLQFDMDSVVAEVERRLESYEDPIEVSVLGCAVNGIGEARHADFGITGAKDMGMIYSKGEPLKKVPTEQLVDELFKEIDRYYAAGKTVQRDEAAAADARRWLAENEDATAMTPERIAMLEAAAGTQLEELGQEDAGAGAVLESMLVGDGPVEAAGAFAAAGEPAGAEPVVLDEAVSPVAGRRFNRA
jgi:(E)-4-hydroxy-3-methylbut-2-enyl-diphosphate synthase